MAGASQTDVLCLEDTNPLGEKVYLHSDEKRIYCDDRDFQTFGDYWCPKGFTYLSDNEVCEKDTAVCDQGFSGQLEHGCDNPLNPNDDHWRLYQKECVFNYQAPENLYDSFCCPDTVFNNFQIWREDADEDHVKVY